MRMSFFESKDTKSSMSAYTPVMTRGREVIRGRLWIRKGKTSKKVMAEVVVYCGTYDCQCSGQIEIFEESSNNYQKPKRIISLLDIRRDPGIQSVPPCSSPSCLPAQQSPQGNSFLGMSLSSTQAGRLWPFQIVLNIGEVLEFFLETPEDREQWMKRLGLLLMFPYSPIPEEPSYSVVKKSFKAELSLRDCGEGQYVSSMTMAELLPQCFPSTWSNSSSVHLERTFIQVKNRMTHATTKTRMMEYVFCELLSHGLFKRRTPMVIKEVLDLSRVQTKFFLNICRLSYLRNTAQDIVRHCEVLEKAIPNILQDIPVESILWNLFDHRTVASTDVPGPKCNVLLPAFPVVDQYLSAIYLLFQPAEVVKDFANYTLKTIQQGNAEILPFYCGLAKSGVSTCAGYSLPSLLVHICDQISIGPADDQNLLRLATGINCLLEANDPVIVKALKYNSTNCSVKQDQESSNSLWPFLCSPRGKEMIRTCKARNGNVLLEEIVRDQCHINSNKIGFSKMQMLVMQQKLFVMNESTPPHHSDRASMSSQGDLSVSLQDQMQDHFVDSRKEDLLTPLEEEKEEEESDSSLSTNSSDTSFHSPNEDVTEWNYRPLSQREPGREVRPQLLSHQPESADSIHVSPSRAYRMVCLVVPEEETPQPSISDINAGLEISINDLHIRVHTIYQAVSLPSDAVLLVTASPLPQYICDQDLYECQGAKLASET